jgi:4,5:9,10-diseco-3-hydroxy-5,9,17-trioxoandrosta-1(10),2-diene-4-oate hydrolase
MQERELWFRCGDHRLRYLHLPDVNGPGLWWWWKRRRPAVVFVHGLMGYSFSWRHNLEFFARHRDVYALDLLGIGHSDRPEPSATDFGLQAAADRLLGFLRGLGQPRIDLVATSHGGAVAMLAASEDYCSPRPVIRRLALVAPAHPFMPTENLNQVVASTSLGRMLVGACGGMVQGRAMSQLYADDSLITPETHAGYAVNFQDERSYDYAIAVAESWREDMQTLKASLPAIRAIPTLLLWGAEDETIPAGTGQHLCECFRNPEFELLPGVGHMPYEEAPEEFNRCLLGFLEK